MKSVLRYEDSELRFGVFGHSLANFQKEYRGPIYLYDLQLIRNRFSQMKNALPKVDIFYAMKANSNLQVLKSLNKAGSGVDVVSVGEIKRALEAGFLAGDIVFSGVGKTKIEIQQAIELNIHQINVESLPELKRIAEISRAKKTCTRVALRLNPNISIKTHPYIATGLKENKFGMELSVLKEIEEVLKDESDSLELVGLSLHLGSQMTEFAGLREALQLLKPIYLQLQRQFPTLQRFDFGGGLGINYEQTDLEEELQVLESYAKVISQELGDLPARLQTEPGRWLVAHAGILLTQIQYVKKTDLKTFVVLDSGMNHLMRPSLYQAFHGLFPTVDKPRAEKKIYDFVGPICESADVFAKDREFPEVQADDFVVIADVGAYGFSMANSYNLQDLPVEICL